MKQIAKYQILGLFIITAFLSSCKNNDKGEENLLKKPRSTTVNVKERLEEYEGGIFSSSKQTDNLGKQNIMWKATLKALDFMPISSVSYDGGMIVTDWYSKENTNESIKITVVFNSNVISANSIEIKSYQKKCVSGQNNCKTKLMGNDFNNKIKSSIIEEVKNLNIQNFKK